MEKDIAGFHSWNATWLAGVRAAGTSRSAYFFAEQALEYAKVGCTFSSIEAAALAAL